MTATVPAPRPSTRHAILAPAAVGVAGVAYLGAVARIDPFSATTVGGVALECPIHAVTGGFCPGCGATRAVHELLHGDLIGSLLCHPMVLPLVGLLAYLWVSWTARRRGRDPWWARTPTELPAVLPMMLVVGFVALTVARNLPGFEWLPPPEVAP